MGKNVGQICKNIQYQISTSSLKAPVSSSSDPQISSAIESTITSVPSIRDKNQNNSVLYSQNTIHNYGSITNNNDILSCDTARKKSYSFPTTSTPNHHTQCFAATSVSILNLHPPTISPPVGKEYMCFQNDGKSVQAARCIKSRIMTKVVYSVLSIDTFEQKCVVLKGMLKSLCLKYHVNTIGIDQSLSNNALYEHNSLHKINKLYKRAGKCDGQQQFKETIEVAMVSTPEGFTDKSHLYLMTSTPVKKKSAGKTFRCEKGNC